MTFQTIMSMFTNPRIFMVFAVLISLCVSSNVGPQFLPLPGLPDREAGSQQQSQNTTASRPPSSELDNFRVPMVGQTQKRTGTESQRQPVATCALTDTFEQVDDIRVNSNSNRTIPLCSSASVERPPGRAPPHSV